jgi:hypothetical protein
MSRQEWDPQAKFPFMGRAYRVAYASHHTWCGIEHALLAILRSDPQSKAATILRDLELDEGTIDRRLRAASATVTSPRQGISPNPALVGLIGVATGLALLRGHVTVTDEDVLIAMSYSRGDHLVALGIDVTRVVDRLEQLPDPMPPFDPPRIVKPTLAHRRRVYYPIAMHSRVVAALLDQEGLGTHRWGTNISNWKPGFMYVDVDPDVDLSGFRTDQPGDPPVEIMSTERAAHLESTSAPRPTAD